MQEIYTADLIRFFYHETSTAENAVIVRKLQSDMSFAEEWESLKTTLSELDMCDMNPHPTSVNLVLEYAHGLVVSH